MTCQAGQDLSRDNNSFSHTLGLHASQVLRLCTCTKTSSQRVLVILQSLNTSYNAERPTSYHLQIFTLIDVAADGNGFQYRLDRHLQDAPATVRIHVPSISASVDESEKSVEWEVGMVGSQITWWSAVLSYNLSALQGLS